MDDGFCRSHDRLTGRPGPWERDAVYDLAKRLRHPGKGEAITERYDERLTLWSHEQAVGDPEHGKISSKNNQTSRPIPVCRSGSVYNDELQH